MYSNTTQYNDYIPDVNSIGVVTQSNTTQYNDYIHQDSRIGVVAHSNTTQYKDYIPQVCPPQSYPRQNYQHHACPPQANPVMVVPLHTQAASKPYNVKAARGLGITQIVIGCICLILNSVMISLRAQTAGIGYGIWGGLLFIGAGIVQVLTSTKLSNRSLITATMVMSILSACVTPILLAYGITETYIYYYGYFNRIITIYSFAIILAILAVVEASIAIATSILCCQAVCQCCGAQPQTAGNQPVVFVSNHSAHQPVPQSVRPWYPHNPHMPSEFPPSYNYVEPKSSC